MSRPKVWAGKQCLVDGCDREVKCRGLCQRHYSYALRHGTVGQPSGRRTFVEVARDARAEAAIALVNAGLLPKSTDPRAVAAALKLDVAHLQGVLQRRRRAWEGPRANADRKAAPPGHKWCPECRRHRPLDEFHHDRNAVDKRCHMCKPCKRTYQKSYRRRAKKRAA